MSIKYEAREKVKDLLNNPIGLTNDGLMLIDPVLVRSLLSELEKADKVVDEASAIFTHGWDYKTRASLQLVLQLYKENKG